jgi:YVTN family beta-propeller protein
MALTVAAALAVTGLAASAPASADIVTSTPGVAVIPVGASPGAVTLSPDGSLAYVLNQDDQTVSVVRTSTSTVTTTIPVGYTPSFTVFTHDGSKAYVFDQGDMNVTVIDVRNSTVSATLPLGQYAFRVFETADGSKILVDDFTTLTTIDTATDALTTVAMPVSRDPVSSSAFSADGSTVYELRAPYPGNGAIRTVDSASGVVTSTTTVGESPSEVVVTPSGSKALVLNSNSVSIVDLAASTVTGTLPLPDAKAMALSSDGATAVVSTHSATVYIIDVAAGAISSPVPVAENPIGIAFSSSGTHAYILSGGPFAGSGSVSDVDLGTKTLAGTIGVGVGAAGIAVGPQDATIFASNGRDNTLSVIDLPLAGWRPSVTRIFGADRFATSVAVSQAWFPPDQGGQAMTLFVASGTNFPDALGAAAIAGQDATPLLLTARDTLPAEVKAEIQRLQPQTIDILGDPNAVSSAVFEELSSLAPQVRRVAGSDRYETNRAVVGLRFEPGARPSQVYVVTGSNFPDALSASAAAATNQAPVVLVNGNASTLDDATISFLSALDPGKFTIVGDPNAVSGGIETALAAMAPTERLGGIDRYQTSELLNEAAFPGSPSRAYLATGSGFADALAGSTLAGARLSPLYVVPSSCIPKSLDNDLASAPVGALTLFGGLPSLSDDVAKLKVC